MADGSLPPRPPQTDLAPPAKLDLPPAYPDRAAWGTATSLRAWQSAALTAYFDRSPRDFLAVATPGAGKTTFALTVASELLARRIVERVTVVAPTEHLKTQWAEAAAKVGIPLDPSYSGRKGRTSSDFVGVAMTYAGVAANPLSHRIRTERFNTLVILDEVHHAGDALSWGEAVREAFEPARRRLALTGTPFRSDVNPIPFVTYAPGDDGVPRSRGRLHLRLRARAGRPRRAPGPVPRLQRPDAVAHARRRRGGCPARRAADEGHDGARAAHGAGPEGRVDPVGARGGRPPALRGAPARPRRGRPGDRHRPGVGAGLRPGAGPGVGREADRGALRREGRLEEDRDLHRRRVALDGGGPDGLRGRRRAPAGRRGLRDHDLDAALLRPGRRPVRAGPQAWRDRVDLRARRCRCCSRTPRRWRSSATTCSVGPITDEDDIFAAEDDLLARAQAAEGASDEELGRFEAMGSEARFDRVLYDGGEFGHEGEVHVGSEEEMDFLGIPGLLEPDQVRDLLRHRQSERARRTPPREAAPRARDHHARAAGA